MSDALPFRPEVRVLPDALGQHSLQLYAGLTQLAAQGEITLSYSVRPTKEDRAFHVASMWLHVCAPDRERPVRVCVDLFDGAIIATPDGLSKCDYYFKRSYSREPLAHLSKDLALKVHPMGLNFGPVGDFDVDMRYRQRIERDIRRALGKPLNRSERTYRFLTRASATQRPWWPSAVRRHLVPRVSEYSPSSLDHLSGKILFQARLWPGASARKDPFLEEMNSGRITMVRALRREFGARFIGGIVPSEYARRLCPDCLSVLPTDQMSYLRLIHEAQIGIVTLGLHRSTPYKWAEYAATGKCIVSTPLVFEMPEKVYEGGEVRTFQDEAGCLDACDRILSDPEVGRGMRFAAHSYYAKWIEPSQLVRRLLQIALGFEPPLHRGVVRD